MLGQSIQISKLSLYNILISILQMKLYGYFLTPSILGLLGILQNTVSLHKQFEELRIFYSDRRNVVQRKLNNSSASCPPTLGRYGWPTPLSNSNSFLRVNFIVKNILNFCANKTRYPNIKFQSKTALIFRILGSLCSQNIDFLSNIYIILRKFCNNKR
jgi:hypothetical protein